MASSTTARALAPVELRSAATWGFPKIGDFNIVITLNSRILIIRTPKKGTPYFRKLPHSASFLRTPRE